MLQNRVRVLGNNGTVEEVVLQHAVSSGVASEAVVG